MDGDLSKSRSSRALLFLRQAGFARPLMAAMANRLGLESEGEIDPIELTRAAIEARPVRKSADRPLFIDFHEEKLDARGEAMRHRMVLTEELVEDAIARIAWGEPFRFEASARVMDRIDGRGPHANSFAAAGSPESRGVEAFLERGLVTLVGEPADPWRAATVEFWRDGGGKLGFPVDIIRRMNPDGCMDLFLRPATSVSFAAKAEVVDAAGAMARDPWSFGFEMIPRDEAVDAALPTFHQTVQDRDASHGRKITPYTERIESMRRALRTFAAVGTPELRRVFAAYGDYGWHFWSQVDRLTEMMQNLTSLCCHEPAVGKRVHQGAAIAPVVLFNPDVRAKVAAGQSPAKALIGAIQAKPSLHSEVRHLKLESDYQRLVRSLASKPGLEKRLGAALSEVGTIYRLREQFTDVVRLALCLAVVGERNPHIRPSHIVDVTSLVDCWTRFGPGGSAEYATAPTERDVARAVAASLKNGQFYETGNDENEILGWVRDETSCLGLDRTELRADGDRMRLVDILYTSAAIRIGDGVGRQEISRVWHDLVNDHLFEREELMVKLRVAEPEEHAARLRTLRKGLALPAETRGGVTLRAVVDPDELMRIGRTMNNCAGAYARPVANGESFVIMLECAGERSLLELRPEGNELRAAQHEGPGRSSPSVMHAGAAVAYVAAINDDAGLVRRIVRACEDIRQERSGYVLDAPFHHELREKPEIAAALEDRVRRTLAALFLPKWMQDAGIDDILEYAAELELIEHLTPEGRRAMVALRNPPQREPEAPSPGLR